MKSEIENKNKEQKKTLQKNRELELQLTKLTKEIKTIKDQLLSKKTKANGLELSSTIQ